MGLLAHFHRDPFFAAWSRKSLVFHRLPPPPFRITGREPPGSFGRYRRKPFQLIIQAFNQLISRSVFDDVHILYDSAYSQPAALTPPRLCSLGCSYCTEHIATDRVLCVTAFFYRT